MFALKFFCQDKSFKNVTQVFQKILIQVKAQVVEWRMGTSYSQI